MENILQWNINGLINHCGELQTILADKSPFCVCLQETHMKPNTCFSLRGYQCFRKDTQPIYRAQGGVATFVKINIPAYNIPLRTNLQAVAVSIESPIKATICNVYLPNSEHLCLNDLQDLSSQLPRPLILLGDFNSNSPWWGSSSKDTRGQIVTSFVAECDLILIHTREPTYFSVASGTFSSIDLTLASSSLATRLYWKQMDDLHFSDHFPVIISTPIPSKERVVRKRWKTDEADWVSFSLNVKTPSIDVDDDDNKYIDKCVHDLTSNIITAAVTSIPRTSGKINSRSVPW